MNDYQAISYIGKTVYSLDRSVSLNGERIDGIHITLSSDAAVVYANIYDKAGNLVKTIKETNVSAGENTITWDGKDSDGNQMADGIYDFEVFAYDRNENLLELTAYTEKRITGITYYKDEPYLSSGDFSIPLSSVFRVIESQEM